MATLLVGRNSLAFPLTWQPPGGTSVLFKALVYKSSMVLGPPTITPVGGRPLVKPSSSTLQQATTQTTASQQALAMPSQPSATPSTSSTLASATTTAHYPSSTS